jgi:hypothetical protein
LLPISGHPYVAKRASEPPKLSNDGRYGRCCHPNEEPGTSETSRFPSDFINGPIVINSIYRLGERLKLTVPEKITPAQRDLIKSMYAHAKDHSC